MLSRKVFVGLTCLTAGSALFTGTAHADRRTGLAGNLLIQDPDDVFPFPQYALVHRNMIRLDYGGGATSGNGVLTLGDDSMAFGIALHRGDILSPDVVGFGQELVWLGGVGDPFADGADTNGTTFSGPAVNLRRPAGVMQGAPGENAAAADGDVPLPSTVLDLMIGGRLTGTSMWGARLGFGRGAQVVNNDGERAKGANNFVALQGGYSSMPEDGLRFDFSGNVVLGIGKETAVVAGNEEDVAKGFDLRVGLLARGYKPINSVVDLGFIGNLSFNHESVNVEAPAEDKQTDMGVGLMGGLGPAIHLDRANIAAYAGVLAAYGRSEPSDETDDDEVTRLQFALPVVNIAAEVQLLDWLYVRTGAQYTWDLRRDAVDDVSERLATSSFAWSAGLGAAYNNFYLDGVISNAFMTNGPAFIGGGTPGFLAMASLTYKFGDVFSGEVAPAPAPAAPAPVAPAPAYEPAPSQETAPPAVDTDVGAGVDTTTTDTTLEGSAGGQINVGQ